MTNMYQGKNKKNRNREHLTTLHFLISLRDISVPTPSLTGTADEFLKQHFFTIFDGRKNERFFRRQKVPDPAPTHPPPTPPPIERKRKTRAAGQLNGQRAHRACVPPGCCCKAFKSALRMDDLGDVSKSKVRQVKTNILSCIQT